MLVAAVVSRGIVQMLVAAVVSRGIVQADVGGSSGRHRILVPGAPGVRGLHGHCEC